MAEPEEFMVVSMIVGATAELVGFHGGREYSVGSPLEVDTWALFEASGLSGKHLPGERFRWVGDRWVHLPQPGVDI